MLLLSAFERHFDALDPIRIAPPALRTGSIGLKFVAMHTAALQTILESLPPSFPSTELLATMFGRYVADVGVAANLSWNAEAGRKLAVVLPALGCEKLGRVHVRDANHWPTSATVWSNPYSRMA